MNLEEFIKDSIMQLVNGIKNAQEGAAKCGAIVMPDMIWTPDASSQPMIFEGLRRADDTGRYVSMLEFDLAITVEEQKEAGGRLQIGMAALGIGGGAGKTTADSTTHRIKFKVPLALPIPS